MSQHSRDKMTWPHRLLLIVAALVLAMIVWAWATETANAGGDPETVPTQEVKR